MSFETRHVRRLMGILLTAVFAASVSGTLLAQTDRRLVVPPQSQPSQQRGVASDPATSDENTTSIRVRSNLVETPVTVTDSHGEFVYDLEKNDFHIFDNGVPQHIVNFVQESRFRKT